MAYYNERRWPGFLAGGVLTALLILGGERAYHTWTWAGEINNEAKASAAYLAQVIGKTPDGKPIHRYDLIDAALQDYITRIQAPKAPAIK